MTSRTTVHLPLGQLALGELPFTAAYDPGGTSGWARFEPGSDYVTCGQIGPQEHHDELFLHLDTFRHWAEKDKFKLRLVYESFQFRQFTGFDKTKVELWSVEYIGVIKLFCSIHRLQPVAQTASIAKGFISDEKLKRLGWYKITAGLPHARDSLRHLLYDMYVTQKIREPFTSKWLVKPPTSLTKGC